MNNFKHKDEWQQKSNKFNVTVSRHEVMHSPLSSFEPSGVHRWAVYAYIFPVHRLFEQFNDTDSFYQDVCTAMPLHSGPSYLRRHRGDSGEVTCYQVGADYNHLHDNSFTFMATAEEAYEVFRDAQALFDYLSDPVSE